MDRSELSELYETLMEIVKLKLIFQLLILLSFCHTNSVAKLDHQTHIYGNSSFTTSSLTSVLFHAKETF